MAYLPPGTSVSRKGWVRLVLMNRLRDLAGVGPGDRVL